MARLFAGLEIPSNVRAQLLSLQEGVPGARWRGEDNLHLTLRFIGEVDARMQRDIDSALSLIDVPAFELCLKGVGRFGKDRPRALWVGVEDDAFVSRLARKIEAALQRNGLKPERRKFTPHVTLAYLNAARHDRVDTYVAEHADFKSNGFLVDRFVLFQSYMGKGASHYAVRAHYPLTDMWAMQGDQDTSD